MAKKATQDEYDQKVAEFKAAFQHLTQSKGWRRNQFSVLHDNDGFFVSVTLEWQRPSEIDAPL